MNTDLMFSSNTGEWETPKELFTVLSMEFNFKIDLAATNLNKKCKVFINKEQDSLSIDWYSLTEDWLWLNPPYGRGLSKWISKCHEQSKKGAKIVCLVPARTDTKWFHDYIYGKYEIRFIKGRLKFGDSTNSAPFPSMLVIFENGRYNNNR